MRRWRPACQRPLSRTPTCPFPSRRRPLRRPGRVPSREVPPWPRAALEQAGGSLFEGTFAVGVDAGAPCRVETDAGGRSPRPRSSSPPTCPSSTAGLYFARCHPERSYVVATPYDRDRPPRAGCTSAPSRRRTRSGPMQLGEQTWLLVGGESHKTGQGNAAERYERLTAWARERFGVEPVMRWATQDQMPADGVPLDRPGRPRLEERVRGHRLSQVGARDGHRVRRVARRVGPRPRPSLARPVRHTSSAGQSLRRLPGEGERERGAALLWRPRRQARPARLDRAGEGRIVGDGLAQRRSIATKPASCTRSRPDAATSAASSTGTPAREPGTVPATARASGRWAR